MAEIEPGAGMAEGTARPAAPPLDAEAAALMQSGPVADPWTATLMLAGIALALVLVAAAWAAWAARRGRGVRSRDDGRAPGED